MKNKSEKIGELLIKIFIIAILSILCLAMFYASIKFTQAYFTNTDEQICQISNSTLIRGQCHYESNSSVNDRRNILLAGGIILPVLAIVLLFYMIVLLKTKLK